MKIQTENSGKKEDLRVRRTKKLLADALFKLIDQRPFDRISVCEICDEAMVHRATFYSHFCDKYALLTYAIDENIPLELPKSSGENKSDFSRESNMVEDIINYISENRGVYAALLKKTNDYSVSDRLQKMFEQNLLKIINELTADGIKINVSPEFWADFYAGACMNVVRKWLSDETRISVSELIENLNSLLLLSLKT